MKEEIKKLIEFDDTQEDNYIVDLFAPFIYQKLKEQVSNIRKDIEQIVDESDDGRPSYRFIDDILSKYE